MTITYSPQIWDARTTGASSLPTLPRLGVDEWPRLKTFMQSHWPEFNLIGTHGEQRARDGERWWAIGAIEVKEGPSLFQVQFRKDATTPDYGNILSFQWFESAPALDQSFDVRYYERGNWAFSEGSGDNGWPYGASGPYSFWVNSDPADWEDRRVGSDAMVNVHWFDAHVSLNAVFWPMRKGGTPPPPDNATEYLVNVAADGTPTGYLAFTPGAPPTSVPPPLPTSGGLALMRGGQVIAYIPWQAV
jgi:hypothetical protein